MAPPRAVFGQALRAAGLTSARVEQLPDGDFRVSLEATDTERMTALLGLGTPGLVSMQLHLVDVKPRAGSTLDGVTVLDLPDAAALRLANLLLAATEGT